VDPRRCKARFPPRPRSRRQPSGCIPRVAGLSPAHCGSFLDGVSGDLRWRWRRSATGIGSSTRFQDPLADGRGNEIQEIPGSHQAEVLHGVALVDFGGGPVEIAHPIPSQPFLSSRNTCVAGSKFHRRCDLGKPCTTLWSYARLVYWTLGPQLPNDGRHRWDRPSSTGALKRIGMSARWFARHPPPLVGATCRAPLPTPRGT
jgi:hypothetical protein